MESTVSASASIARVGLQLGGRYRHDVYKGRRGRPVVWSRRGSRGIVSSCLTAGKPLGTLEGSAQRMGQP